MEKSLPGRQAELLDLLAYLISHLEIASACDEHALNALHEKLSRALSHEDLAALKNRYFSIENSDLFFTVAVAPQQRRRLAHLAERIATEPPPPDLRVFVRDVPVRTTRLTGSVPLWAGGPAVAKTLGPYHGRRRRSDRLEGLRAATDLQ